MTRDNALIYIHGMATGHHKKATKNHYNDIAQAVNDIYDDVESRTCENCKHLNMSKFHFNEGGGDMYIPCELIYVETTGANTLQEFGCNMFERGLS